MLIRLSLLSFCFSFLLLSCSTAPSVKSPPPEANSSVQSEIDSAKNELTKNPSSALKKLEQIILKNQSSSASSDAARIAGDYYFQNQKFSQSLNAYLYILNNRFQEPYEVEVCLRVIDIYQREGDRQNASSWIKKALQSKDLSLSEKISLLEKKVSLLREEQNPMDLLYAYSELYQTTDDPSKKISYKIYASSVSESFDQEDQLKKLLDEPSLRFIHPSIHYRLGTLNFDQSKLSLARMHFSQVIALAPNSDLAESSAEFINQIDARAKVSSRTIGVILPLSGKHATLGRSVLNSIQLGLGLLTSSSGLKLSIIDSGDTYIDARRAVEKLVVEDHVIGIIGSLQSKVASGVSSKAQSLGVPTIILSQKSGITNVGDYIFRNALTSKMQTEYLVSTSINDYKISRFAILYPEDSYGAEYANLFWDEVEKQGGQIRAAQAYNPNETDFHVVIEKLVGTYYTADRAQEYKAKLGAWEKKNPSKSSRSKVPDDLLPPIVDFDAIFIPDNTKTLGQISAMLSFQEVSGVRLLGPNIWNTPSVVERSGAFSKSLLFVDSFLSNDPSFTSSDFYKNYSLYFKKIPSLFDLQAYDSAVLLKEALSSATTRDELRSQLFRLKSRGALGTISVLESRDFSRPIIPLTVIGKEIVRADVAPSVASEINRPSKKNKKN